MRATDKGTFLIYSPPPIKLCHYLVCDEKRQKTWRPRCHESGTAAGLGGTLIALFVEYSMHNHMFENHLWLIVGMSFALRRLASVESPTEASAVRLPAAATV